MTAQLRRLQFPNRPTRSKEHVTGRFDWYICGSWAVVHLATSLNGQTDCWRALHQSASGSWELISRHRTRKAAEDAANRARHKRLDRFVAEETEVAEQ